MERQSEDNIKENISGPWTKTRINGWLDSFNLSNPSKR
jgi:hypothetical protein